MSEILHLTFGIALTFIGFRAYSYFDKNLETINNKPGNLYGTAVLLILIGIFITIFSIINLF
jgi:hypothetical protein